MIDAVKKIDNAFILIIAVSLVLLLLITAAMVYFLFRFRSGRNPEASDIRSNLKIEILWTVLPSIIALWMFYLGWQSYIGLRQVPPGALEIDVAGMEFAWVFTYPGNKESEGILTVPLGKPVKLNVTSLDVIHSLYIPAFRIKVDAVKNMKTYTWFYPDKPGTYVIYCAEYCGAGHADMNAELRIVSEAEYAEWLKSL